MSENSRHYFNLAKVILDASFLEESVLIQEALSMKGSDDHKKKRITTHKKPQQFAKGKVTEGLHEAYCTHLNSWQGSCLYPYRPD